MAIDDTFYEVQPQAREAVIKELLGQLPTYVPRITAISPEIIRALIRNYLLAVEKG